jgi:hypothetical protein
VIVREPIVGWRQWNFMYPHFLANLGNDTIYVPREKIEAHCSMKGHVKNKLQAWRLAKDSFMDSLPLLRRELPLSPSCPQLFSLRFSRCGSLGVPVTSASDSCRCWSYLKLCRCFGSLG